MCFFFLFITYFLSCHKAEEEYKPEEADLFLRMDALKDSDGTLTATLVVVVWLAPLKYDLVTF